MPPQLKNRWQQAKPALRWILKASVLVAIWGGVTLGAILAWYGYDMPDVRQVTQPERRPSVTILTDDGSVLARYGDLFGRHVRLGDVPPDLVHAIVAVEDRRFYGHFGIDLIGLMRATVQNILARRVVQGGSTLTQQLAKNLFLTPERTFRRKVQEMLLAFWLERTYSKDQILTAYLNRVYFGAGAYGVDAAAEAYFNKRVEDVNLREAAMLAGLLRAPSRFSPKQDPAQAMARAGIVLAAMEDAGYISGDQKNAAGANIPMPRRKPGASGDGRYFADWVTDQVNGLLANAPQDLVISTTLDFKLQRMAERHLTAILAADANKDVTQGALVTLAPDGAVRAMVGGRDYAESQFNRATQAMRQPGSSFKPVVYLAAIREGMSPYDTFEDAPLSVGHWSPENYDGQYRGSVTAREALADSINTVAVRVLQKAGIPRAIETARALGITSPIGHDLSLALGTNTLTPLELTGAYASIAAGGRAISPYAIKEIRNRSGQVLYRRPDVTPPVTVDPQAVATLVDMMTEVINSGTGRRAALGRPVAGKTGTSSDYHDAWFLGFTGDYVTGVWLGNDDNKPMKKVTGGSLPAAVWHDYMMEAEANLPVRDLLYGSPVMTAHATETYDAPDVSSGVSDVLGGLIRSLTGQ
ncbi:MAG: PBP1A family penicillin-binding protein [Alphaproteobacteria bacterium]|nr:PBP1A family penicillin-binding protein [Alphaproteobacteria bacterium]